MSQNPSFVDGVSVRTSRHQAIVLIGAGALNMRTPLEGGASPMHISATAGAISAVTSASARKRIQVKKSGSFAPLNGKPVPATRISKFWKKSGAPLPRGGSKRGCDSGEA